MQHYKSINQNKIKITRLFPKKNTMIMEENILIIINKIRVAKDLTKLSELHTEDRLREDLDLTSFDLAELTVNIEDIYGVDVLNNSAILKVM